MTAGSYQYLYIAATARTAPNSTPQTPGNSCTQVTGLSRTSKSAILNGSTVMAVSKPPTYGWTQNTVLYAGSDPGQFNDESPAEIILVTYTI
ncbi:hypothetical protein FRC01_007366 [Tulasnella sp. 417]|nr:hypothetical protein FRC01_007366 [Tulasnella sp. 417]